MNQMWERISEVWTATSPTPEGWQWVVGAAAFLVVVVMPPDVWVRLLRPWVTLLHETGHAVGALVTGRRVVGVAVHADTSGLTTTRGRSGPTAHLSTFTGYPFPAWAAAVTVLAVATGRYGALLLGAGAVGAALLIAARTWRAAAGLIVLTVPAGLLLWQGPGTLPSWLLGVIPALLLALSGATLAGAARSLIEEAQRRRHGEVSDVSLLPGNGRIAATSWWLLMWLSIVAPLVVVLNHHHPW